MKTEVDIPLGERMNDWSDFEGGLFNLITFAGKTGLIFSKRLAVTQKVLDAFNEAVREAKRHEN